MPSSPYARAAIVPTNPDDVLCQIFTRQVEDEDAAKQDMAMFLPIKLENNQHQQQQHNNSTVLVDNESKKRYKLLPTQQDTGCYHCELGSELRLRIRNKNTQHAFSFCLLFQDAQGLVTSIFPLISVHLNRESFVRLQPNQELVLSIPTDTLPIGVQQQQALVSLMLVATACHDVKQVVHALRTQSGTKSSSCDILTLHHYPFIMALAQSMQDQNNVQQAAVAVW